MKKSTRTNRRPATKTATVRMSGVGEYMKTHIQAGKTNEQVWKLAARKFELDETKRHYPAWYRGQLRRAGTLSKIAAKVA